MSLRENDIISKTLLTIDKYKSYEGLKSAIADNEYNPHTSYFVRSLIWKTVFITESTNIQVWAEKLQNSRRVYHELLKDEEMYVPWNKLEPDSEYYQALNRQNSVRKTRKQKSTFTRVSVDPLNETPQDASGDTSTDMDGGIELLKIIILDIDRIFPGEQFFNVNYRRQLIEILFVWSKCNGKIGYKQGFHEIIGLIFKNLHRDCITIPSTNSISTDDYKILNLYDLNYLKHDLFTIFNKFMNNFGIIHNYYENEAILIEEIDKLNQYLMKVDQLIHYNLISKLKLESQLWCIRYFRLILLREFNDLDHVSYLWDKIITVEATKFSNLLIFIIIVMLVNLKSELIICDFSESLSLLLHYPNVGSGSGSESSSVSGLGTGSKHPQNGTTNTNTKEHHAFFNNLFKYSMKLLNVKDNDLKLYELGLKLNEKFNPDLKISLSFNGTRSSMDSSSSRNTSRMPSPSRSSSPMNSLPMSNLSLNNGTAIPSLQPDTKPSHNSRPENTTPAQLRAEKMAFEKYRMEMRLKKKAQSLMRS